MVPIEQKDWTEEDRASKLGQNHPLDSTKRLNFVTPAVTPVCAENLNTGVVVMKSGQDGA